MSFRCIPNYPTYIINKKGNIFSLKNQIFLKYHINRNGYFTVRIWNDIPKTHLVHRLVAQTFIPNNLNKATVDHINGSRQDNRVCNLRWASRQEQVLNRNKPKVNKWGTTGVAYRVKRDSWQARITIKKVNYRKEFYTYDEAVVQRNKWLEIVKKLNDKF